MDQEKMDESLALVKSQDAEEIIQIGENPEKEWNTLYQLSKEVDKQYEQLITAPMTLDDYMKYMASTSRTGEVNHDETIELVSAAKGDRSIRSFAETVGVSASTITRILNGQTSEISPNLISKIVGYADEDSGVTLEKMMAAQGLEKSAPRKKQRQRAESQCRMILTDELLQQGFKVQYVQQVDSSNMCVSDFRIMTDALGKEDSLWLLEYKSDYDVQSTYRSFSGWLNRVMAYYYVGGRAGRASLIVENNILFKQMKERLSKIMVPDEISVILLSTRQGLILEEYVAPLKGGRKPKFVLVAEKGVEE